MTDTTLRHIRHKRAEYIRRYLKKRGYKDMYALFNTCDIDTIVGVLNSAYDEHLQRTINERVKAECIAFGKHLCSTKDVQVEYYNYKTPEVKEYINQPTVKKLGL